MDKVLEDETFMTKKLDTRRNDCMNVTDDR